MGQEQGTPSYCDIEFLGRRISNLEELLDQKDAKIRYLEKHCDDLETFRTKAMGLLNQTKQFLKNPKSF